MEIFITIILTIILIIYLKMYNSHPFFLLDKNGILKKEFNTKFALSYITINPEEFKNFEEIHKRYFPNGTCKISKTSYTSANTLYIDTSEGNEKYLPTSFIVRKVKESPDIYYMYLVENYISYEGKYSKGKVFQGSVSELEQEFKLWEKKQLAFLKAQGNIYEI